MALRVVFMGTPDFSVPTLDAIAAAGHDIVAVYTRAPKPAGRGMAEQPSPVHEKARALGASLVMPRTLRIPAAETLFRSHGADVAVVVAYGLILPKAILDAPRSCCLNLHASLLPRWRGAAPIERAVMAGDDVTGVAIMKMEEGLDTGPICLAQSIAIDPDETAAALRVELAQMGAALMVEALARLERGTLVCAPQPDSGVTYATKIGKDESRIDWSLPAGTLHNLIRGLSPFPGAWFEMIRGKAKERVKVLRTRQAAATGEPGMILGLDPLIVGCGEGALELLEVQRAGKTPIAADAFLRGARLEIGARLA